MSQKIVSLLFMLMCAVIIAGCNSSVRFATRESNSSPKHYAKEHYTPVQSVVISEAEKWLGTPYCYGGESLSCTDCSGFVQKVFLATGRNIPRTAAMQFEFALKVPQSESRPGDLVFFKNAKRINHVGLYIGNNIFIHSSSSNGVEKQTLSNFYYRSRLAGFGRILN